MFVCRANNTHQSNLVRQEYAATVRHMVAADAMYNSITAPPYPC